MTIRLAINGFGRIGRCVLRALYEEKRWDDVQVVAINTLGDLETNAHLLRYDTTHGRFASKVEILDGQDFAVDGDKIKIDIPAGKLELDVSAKEIAARLKKFKHKEINPTGYMLRYSYLVTDAPHGAVMKKKF